MLQSGFLAPAATGAPISMVVPPHLQVSVTLTTGLLALATILITIWKSDRQNLAVNLMVILSGAAGRVAGAHCRFPPADLAPGHRPMDGDFHFWPFRPHLGPAGLRLQFWRPGVLLLWVMRKNPTPAKIWALMALFALTDLATELPGLFQHGFVYYGDQPFTWKPWEPQPPICPSPTPSSPSAPRSARTSASASCRPAGGPGWSHRFRSAS